MGPTAIVSLMTYQAVQNHGVEHAILLCFLSGVVEVLMGIAGLGKYFSYFTFPFKNLYLLVFYIFSLKLIKILIELIGVFKFLIYVQIQFLCLYLTNSVIFQIQDL